MLQPQHLQAQSSMAQHLIRTSHPFVAITVGGYHCGAALYPWLQKVSSPFCWVEMPSPRILSRKLHPDPRMFVLAQTKNHSEDEMKLLPSIC